MSGDLAAERRAARRHEAGWSRLARALQRARHLSVEVADRRHAEMRLVREEALDVGCEHRGERGDKVA